MAAFLVAADISNKAVNYECIERLIKYAAFPTASDENSDSHPSTPAQTVFAEYLADELKTLGASEVELDENGYLFATIPSNSGREAPTVGFIAHMDVVSEVPFQNVRPKVIENYDGGVLTLDLQKNIAMSPDEYPSLRNYAGKTLIVTDGSTLLGADDKAGIAEIITFAERLLSDPSIIHGRVRLGFTPDEEIGRGADLFDVKRFGADFAYTCDGGAFGEDEYETFNAASLKVEITGKSVHPGGAKDVMINASNVAAEYIMMLPVAERPENTSGYEGFYHVTSLSGSVEHAAIGIILRDHDRSKLEDKKAAAIRIAQRLNRFYGEGTVKTEIADSYSNMREILTDRMDVVELASEAVKDAGGTPVSAPVW